MSQKRGELTEKVNGKAKELLGYNITIEELRLMPFIQYCMMNDQKVGTDKVNQEEIDIIAKWVAQGRMKYDTPHIGVLKNFGIPLMRLCL